jgi:hypothetical protein
MSAKNYKYFYKYDFYRDDGIVLDYINYTHLGKKYKG